MSQRPYQQVDTQYNNYPPNYIPQQQGQYGFQSQNQNQVHSTVTNVPVQSQSNQFDMSASFGQHNEPLSPEFSRV
jgi:hypothetical protein